MVEQSNGWKRFWNSGRFWKALVAVVGYIVMYQLAGLALGPLVGDQIDKDNLFATPASVFFGLGAAIVVGSIILIVFTASVGWLRPLFAKQPIGGRWWMWIFVLLVITPIVLRFVGIDYGFYGADVVVTSLFVGLLIGFAEELLYRGIVVKILRDAGHREWIVAVGSALLFALSHSINLLVGQPVIVVLLTVVYTFGFGILMYLVMRVTGNLVWAMLVHAMTDPTTFLAAGAVDASTGVAHSPILDIAGPFNIIFFVAALVALIFIRGRVAQPAHV